jgi:hypothetical protein
MESIYFCGYELLCIVCFEIEDADLSINLRSYLLSCITFPKLETLGSILH